MILQVAYVILCPSKKKKKHKTEGGKKQWDEKVIIRSSHQTDMVIKAEDIKKII